MKLSHFLPYMGMWVTSNLAKGGGDNLAKAGGATLAKGEALAPPAPPLVTPLVTSGTNCFNLFIYFSFSFADSLLLPTA